MKIGFVSDLHAALKLPMAKLDDGGVHSDRLRDVISVIDQVAVRAEEERYRAVFVLGDLFDQRTPDAPTLVHTSAALQRLSLVTEVFLLPGNHDAHDRDGRLYSLQQFAELDCPNINVLRHGLYELDSGLVFSAVPWLPEDRALRMIQRRGAEAPDGLNVLLCHQAFRGARWDSGTIATEGIDPEAVSVAREWDAVLSGHFHRRQLFGVPDMMYLGAPLDLRFGDEAIADRGFLEMTVRAASLEFVEVPVDYPRFQTIELDVEGLLAFHASESPVDTEYTRILVRGTAKELLDADDLIDSVIARYAPERRHFRVERRVVAEAVVERLKVTPVMQHNEVLAEYARRFKPDGQDLEELIKVGSRFMEG